MAFHSLLSQGMCPQYYNSLSPVSGYLLGDVEAQSVHDVSEEEEVDLALAIPVVDVTDVLDLCTGHDQLVSSAQRLPSKAEQREC